MFPSLVVVNIQSVLLLLDEREEENDSWFLFSARNAHSETSAVVRLSSYGTFGFRYGMTKKRKTTTFHLSESFDTAHSQYYNTNEGTTMDTPIYIRTHPNKARVTNALPFRVV